jgi:hypothetical protein
VVTKDKDLKQKQAELNLSYDQLKEALAKARDERDRAELEQKRAEKASAKAREAQRKAEAAGEQAKLLADSERKAKAKLEQLLQKERANVQRLMKERRKITTELR